MYIVYIYDIMAHSHGSVSCKMTLFDPTLANAAGLKPKAIGETARSVLPEADGRIQVTRKKSSVWNNWCDNKR